MFHEFSLSLADLLGQDYMDSVAGCAALLHGLDPDTLREAAYGKVPFLSQARQTHLEDLLKDVGNRIVPPFRNDNRGAPTESYRKAANTDAAPLGGIGPFRVGEDGRLYFTSKSEHYHTPLGHAFEGYRLIDRARTLGIPNATHNNTRGYITRLLEKELVRCLHGLARGQEEELGRILRSEQRKVLNRVINLETGSLAVEAGVKMMLARFYRLEATSGSPRYEGRIPVFLVMADNDGGPEANYHGTTLFTQMFRGLWPELRERIERDCICKVVPVRPNDAEDFHRKVAEYNQGDFKTAGFLHEIILMNYGGIRLTEDFLLSAYRDCAATDTPTLVDEIQSCMWCGGMFLFRKYGLDPDFVILGKGFPGGEYPASKIITTHEMDSLSQFGALVTNGQEELASLAYLVTMEFAQRNADAIDEMGRLIESELQGLRLRHGDLLLRIEGRGHLAALHFQTVRQAIDFSARMNRRCFDVSAQTYKANCPPAALLKPPVLLNRKMVAALVRSMEEALDGMESAAPASDAT